MDASQRRRARAEISKRINIDGQRFKADELDRLLDLCKGNIPSPMTVTRSDGGFDSSDTYAYSESTTYEVLQQEGGQISSKITAEIRYDDGQVNTSAQTYDSGRGILAVMDGKEPRVPSNEELAYAEACQARDAGGTMTSSGAAGAQDANQPALLGFIAFPNGISWKEAFLNALAQKATECVVSGVAIGAKKLYLSAKEAIRERRQQKNDA